MGGLPTTSGRHSMKKAKAKVYKPGTPGYNRLKQKTTLTQVKKEIKAFGKDQRKLYKVYGLIA